jgi:tetratricopeptide (TPR) repeat protein
VTPEQILAAAAAGRWREALDAWQGAWSGQPPSERAALAAFSVGAAVLGRSATRDQAIDRLAELGLPGGLQAGMEGAAGATSRLLGLGRDRLDAQGRLLVAEALERAGRIDEAIALVPRDFERSPRGTGQAGRLLVRCGAFDEAGEVLGRARAGGDADAAEAEAALLLWRGRIAEAGRLTADLPSGRTRWRLEGLLAEARGGDGGPALRAAAEAGDGEARRWIAEALLRSGGSAESEALIAEAWATRFDVVSQLLLVGAAAAAPGRWERLVTAHPLPFDGFLDEVAPGLPEGAGLDRSDPARARAWVLSRLDELGWNRSDALTVGCGEGLRRFTPPATSRSVAASALDLLADGGPGATFVALDRAAARFPRSPHPWTYRGEVLLWMGRTDEAAACLRRAQASARCRWGWVGWSAAAGLRGLDRTAEEAARRSRRDFGPLPGSTLGGYRGERLAARGRADEARAELQEAVRARPSRIGAWVLLARLDPAAADELEARAPGLLFEARALARSAGDPLDCALELLAGNRASRMVTVARGHAGLRVLPDPRAWARIAGRLAAWIDRSSGGGAGGRAAGGAGPRGG